jgi:hypothetical protein
VSTSMVKMLSYDMAIVCAPTLNVTRSSNPPDYSICTALFRRITSLPAGPVGCTKKRWIVDLILIIRQESSKTALRIMQLGTFFGAGWYVVHLIGLEHIDQTKPNEPIRATTLPGFDITKSV